ncbi:MAG: DUF362 domain-containing protein [candidate division KSB1 bacterium]|nr:DUF362 domain-containing protein [candidate division KSB1 bacterium]MDZ7300555.1 DUF362 domain-containing protein [candidate division KSB1 bacterium]MDZ7309694.1 DUF362 domain-containing protein [candidate division KSB1 bacterium]
MQLIHNDHTGEKMEQFYTTPKQSDLNRSSNGWSRLLFPFIGIASLLWFLIRVIPKPSRATYPCMKVAAPIASSFVIWLIGLVTSSLAFAKARQTWRQSRYWIAGTFAVLGLIGMLWTTTAPNKPVQASYSDFVPEPNQPIGTAKGIFPGRVVWVWNPDATNENCNPASYGHSWFMPENNNQVVIDKMLSDGIKALTGASTDAAAWDAIFKFHNQERGKGNVGYQKGEKIFIKTNATSSWSGNFSTRDLSAVNNFYYGVAETSPELVLSVLRQLVNVVGVAQSDIYIGDPIKHIYKHAFDLWQPEFPNVHYMDFSYGAEKNREKFAFTNAPTISYSDRGTVMTSAGSDNLCTLFETCEYLINIPTLKGHARAGITMFAKNHFGSQSRSSAAHLHEGLVDPNQNNPYRQGFGLYRVQVDLMGHKWLGGKLLFCLMDALFAGPEAVARPTKWQITPFKDDWTSSIFLSQDPVAIESVGYDFLRAEYTSTTPYAWVQMQGVDDYLHQAADKSNWPQGISYDPENDGTEIGSLGVHEHWNGVDKKQYSRNLGTGNGIELVFIDQKQVAVNERMTEMPDVFKLYANYPNPFNPSTNICYELSEPSWVELTVFNAAGQKIATLVSERQNTGSHTVAWNGTLSDGTPAASGLYLCALRAQSNGRVQSASAQMLLMR